MSYREKIAQLALGFIKDGSVVRSSQHPNPGTSLSSNIDSDSLALSCGDASPLTCPQTETDIRIRHRGPASWTRVRLIRLLMLFRSLYLILYRVKTQEALTAAGIPCTVVLDSAVAYVMDKVDLVLVGSEAVVESGGLINAVGSNQLAIIAKAANKPVYAMAERYEPDCECLLRFSLTQKNSYKFHRLFPLSQYDLPTHTSNILSFPRQPTRPSNSNVARPSVFVPMSPISPIKPKLPPPSASAHSLSYSEFAMSPEQIRLNPEVDYTRYVITFDSDRRTKTELGEIIILIITFGFSLDQI